LQAISVAESPASRAPRSERHGDIDLQHPSRRAKNSERRRPVVDAAKADPTQLRFNRTRGFRIETPAWRLGQLQADPLQ
jgi:hypothetical protein